MARKSIGYTKLIWVCPNCQTRNPGPKKTCSTCGSPQPEDVSFFQADQEELLQKEEEILKAKKGADIHCPYCGTRNPADASKCSQCGGKLVGGKKRKTGRVVGAHTKASGKGVTCKSCGTVNKPNAPRCTNCGSALEVRRKKKDAREKKKASGGSGGMIWIILGAVVVIIIGVLIARGCSRSVEIGTVTRAEWVRTIAVEQFIHVIREDWWDDIPDEAYVTACEDRYRYTSNQQEENSIEVCGTPYTVDKGTGYGEVVQDCEYDVYDVYCEYETSDWEVVEILQMDGYGTNASWPGVDEFSDQRAGNTTETYTIWFETEDGTISFETEDYSLFQSLREGTDWELNFDGFGNIRDIKRR